MNLLEQFLSYLLNQKNKPSFLTVKNYKADINQFVSWCEKEFKIFNPKTITYSIIQKYKEARKLSESSIERHTSSLRKFFNFLEEKGIVSHSPFPSLTHQEKIEPDPWMIRNFKSFLYDLRKSDLTIKNYINDIKSFFVWFEEVALLKYAWNLKDQKLLEKINFSVIEEYKQRLIAANFSPSTINRKLSSLRIYVSWARNQGFIKTLGLIHNATTITQNVPKSQTQATNESQLPPVRLVKKSAKGLGFFFDYLFILPLAQIIQSIEYVFWKISGKKVFKKSSFFKTPLVQPNEVSNLSREFYAPLSISTKYLSLRKRLWHYLRHRRPNWYKKYHSHTLSHYFHFAILTIFSCILGLGIYNNYFTDSNLEQAVLGSTNSSPPRILSFQGKLTDSTESPISKDTSILFSLYKNVDASSAASLWKENNIVKPDSEGVFSVLLGKNVPIPDSIFSQNSQLYLGITVGSGPELKPRQQLATVPFASNSETLQGLTPITNSTQTSNVVLALNSSGDLAIAGNKTHKFQTIGGQFILSGKILTLTSAPGSNSNVEISPDGTGKIDLTKPIQNSSNYNNLTGVSGAVEFDDVVAILATSSAQSAFYVNQNSTGPLISALTNGTAKFTIENDGSGKFAGDIAVNGGDISSTATTFNLLTSTTLTTLNISHGGGRVYNKGSLTIDKDLDLPSFTSNGGILYTNGSGRVYQISAGGSTDCLKGGTTPSFSSCSSSNVFREVSGAVYPANTTSDLLLGGTATSSALVKLTGTNVSGSNNSWINAGNLGIGTTAPTAKLDVVGGQTKIELSTQYTQRLCHNGSDGTSTQSVLLGDCDAGGADIAEYYGSTDLTIEAGDIVIAAGGAKPVGKNSKAYANKSNSPYSGAIIGIVSSAPYDSFGKNFDESEYSFPVALAGRVPIKITLENGPIKAGDLLTSSSIPGVAMKATKAGFIIGKALEDIDLIDETKIIGYFDPENNEYRNKSSLPEIPVKSSIIPVAKIHAFANISWYDPNAYLTDNGQLSIRGQESNYEIVNQKNENLANVGGFFKVLAANIETGIIKASEIVAQTLIVTSDNIIVNGQNLKDYISNLINESGIRTQTQIVSPIVNTNQLATNIISPLSDNSNISISLQDSQFLIRNSKDASSSAVALIDNQGNASFSGHLSANTGNFNEATISGTLRADKIIANSIEGLEARVSSIAADTILNTKYNILNTFSDIASLSGQLAYVPDLTADRAQFNQGLMVFGPTSASDLSLVGRLTIGGTMFLTENSIEALGTDLAIQSLRQGGISMMAGLIHIDTDGNVKVQGDLRVLGKLAVNIISPIPTSDLRVMNASGSSILAINQAGDIIASGSGTFEKIKLSLVSPVLAISPDEVIASASAGQASIAPFRSEITIKNKLISNGSIIYITPVGTPSAQAPFLMRQASENSNTDGVEGAFTVGVESPTNRPIDFNWLIVN